MRLRLVPVVVCAATVVGLGACGPDGRQGGPQAGGPQTSGPQSGAPQAGGPGQPGGTTGPAPATTAPPRPPAVEPAAPGLEHRVSYNWGVPSGVVTVDHPLAAPLPPPGLPLPYLVGVYVGNHPSAAPPFQRISFYFRGAFPSYNFRYVANVPAEGTGDPVPLTGNSYLRVGFTDAQAHDDRGSSTIAQTPRNPIGFANLKSYGFAGDFEGHVTYGLGIQVAPGSDQVLKIRAGELKKPDGSGGFFYVVYFDVQAG